MDGPRLRVFDYFYSYVIQCVQDNSLQVLIEPIGFTVEVIFKDIILCNSCGIDICVKVLAR